MGEKLKAERGCPESNRRTDLPVCAMLSRSRIGSRRAAERSIRPQCLIATPKAILLVPSRVVPLPPVADRFGIQTLGQTNTLATNSTKSTRGGGGIAGKLARNARSQVGTGRRTIANDLLRLRRLDRQAVEATRYFFVLAVQFIELPFSNRRCQSTTND